MIGNSIPSEAVSVAMYDTCEDLNRMDEYCLVFLSRAVFIAPIVQPLGFLLVLLGPLSSLNKNIRSSSSLLATFRRSRLL